MKRKHSHVPVSREELEAALELAADKDLFVYSYKNPTVRAALLKQHATYIWNKANRRAEYREQARKIQEKKKALKVHYILKMFPSLAPNAQPVQPPTFQVPPQQVIHVPVLPVPPAGIMPKLATVIVISDSDSDNELETPNLVPISEVKAELDLVAGASTSNAQYSDTHPPTADTPSSPPKANPPIKEEENINQTNPTDIPSSPPNQPIKEEENIDQTNPTDTPSSPPNQPIKEEENIDKTNPTDTPSSPPKANQPIKVKERTLSKLIIQIHQAAHQKQMNQ